MKIDYKIIFFVALLLLYLSFANNYIGSNADDSIYVVLGNSLAEGNGYRMISSPENYVNAEYPPLFPIFIAGIILVGGNIFIIKLFIAILAVIGVYSLYLFLKLFFKEKKAFIITVLTGISPLFVFYTHQVMSEVPYFLFSILALYFFVKFMDNKFSKKYLFLCSLFLLLSYFTRTIGFVLIIAIGLYITFERLNKQEIRKFVFIILIIAIPILLWSVRILGNEGETYEQYSYKDLFLKNSIYDFDSGSLDSNGIINRVVYNGEKHITQFSKTIFDSVNWLSLIYPSLKWVELSVILLVFFTIIGGFIVSLKNRTIIEYYFFVYIFFILLIPDPSSRFLFPVIPFIINYFFKGIEIVSNKLDKKIIMNLLIILVIICSLLSLSKDIYFEHKEDYYLNNWGENVDGFVDMALWSKDNIPKENNVIVYNPMMFYLLSDIKGNSPYLSYNKEEVLNQIYKKNAEYVIIDKGVGKRYLAPVISEDRFERVYEKDGNYIYKVKPLP